MWIILIVLYYLFATVAYLTRRKIAEHNQKYNLSINAIFYLFFLLPASWIMGLIFPHNLDIGWLNLILLLVGSVIWPVLQLTIYRSNKTLDAGTTAMLSNLTPLVTLTAAILILHESLDFNELVGIGLLIASGLFIAMPLYNDRHDKDHKDLYYGFLSVVILGLAIVYEKMMLSRVDFGTYLLLGWGSQVVWSVILAHKKLHQIPEIFAHKKLKPLVLAFAISSTLGSIFFINALRLVDSSIFAAAQNFQAVSIIFAGYIFLNEKQHLKTKLIAAITGIVGLFLIV